MEPVPEAEADAPVPEAEADAPVPLDLALPEVEVGTSVAVHLLAFVLASRSPCFPLFDSLGVRTNLDALIVAHVCKSAQSLLCVVATVAGDLCCGILGLADGLHVHRVRVLVDSAEETARRRSDGELRERKEGSGEDRLGEHVGGVRGWCERSKWFDRVLLELKQKGSDSDSERVEILV